MGRECIILLVLMMVEKGFIDTYICTRMRGGRAGATEARTAQNLSCYL